MTDQNGNLGDPQQVQAIAQSMRTIAASQRAAGQSTVPLAWVDSWAAELEAAYPVYAQPAYPYQQYPYQQYPYQQYPYSYPYQRPYITPFFHPIEAFFPFDFGVNFRTTTVKTLK